MELIRESLIHQHLKDHDWVRDEQRGVALLDALKKQRDTFEYFTSISFREPLPLGDTVVRIRAAIHRVEETAKHHVKYFVAM